MCIIIFTYKLQVKNSKVVLPTSIKSVYVYQKYFNKRIKEVAVEI